MPLCSPHTAPANDAQSWGAEVLLSNKVTLPNPLWKEQFLLLYEVQVTEEKKKKIPETTEVREKTPIL